MLDLFKDYKCYYLSYFWLDPVYSAMTLCYSFSKHLFSFLLSLAWYFTQNIVMFELFSFIFVSCLTLQTSTNYSLIGIFCFLFLLYFLFLFPSLSVVHTSPLDLPDLLGLPFLKIFIKLISHEVILIPNKSQHQELYTVCAQERKCWIKIHC